MSGTQHALSEYFRAQAQWRDQKNDEYPDDPRNELSAAALRALADHVERLPDDDPRIVAAGDAVADEILEFTGLDVLGGYSASRIGFAYPPRGQRADGDPAATGIDLDRELTWYVRENLQQMIRDINGDTAEWAVTERERLRDIELALLSSLP